MVTRIAFSPNGDQLASSGDDRTVRLWSVASGVSLAVIDRFLGSVNILEWRTKFGQDYLIAGRMDPRPVDESEGQGGVQLCWIPARRLGLTNTTMLDASGLSDLDKRLLLQRGAVNVPALG